VHGVNPGIEFFPCLFFRPKHPGGQKANKESNHTTELHAATNYTLLKLTHILLHATKKQTSIGTSIFWICSSFCFIFIFIFIENSILLRVMLCSLTEICQCSFQPQGLQMSCNFYLLVKFCNFEVVTYSTLDCQLFTSRLATWRNNHGTLRSHNNLNTKQDRQCMYNMTS
jgi:hypothetical protein